MVSSRLSIPKKKQKKKKNRIEFIVDGVLRKIIIAQIDAWCESNLHV